MMKRMTNCSLLALSFASSMACGDDASSGGGGTGGEGSGPDGVPNPAAVEMLANEARTTYAQVVVASYQDSLSSAEDLAAAIEAFIAAPSEANMTAARQAWLDSREPYLQTEVYRFYNGPIDNEQTGAEGSINAWPLDEAFIDYVEGDPEAGIINDPEVTIDAEMLNSLNAAEGNDTNVATGYHAIEFLLWGQDMSETGPGERPFTDYVEGDGGTAANQARRAQYLASVSGLLVTQLSDLVTVWSSSAATAYPAEFRTIAPLMALSRILTGMTVLSGFETGGERLQTALDTHDQEDEHSCFSDNTHRDFIQNIQGMLNVWQGSYTRLDGSTVSGTGVRDVVEAMDEELAQQLDAQIAQSLTLAEALVAPFDQEIADDNSEGNARVAVLVTSLLDQERLLEDVFRLFALDVPPDP